ncbi:hypothetical protein DB35_24945 [Streptomyces abyssalis]|uniref:Uncharacterized protein n=1 Tax=Streptomyces abyssalis TaxID=933944 RepID=A0A1E7JNA3_9ACTN|nr:hypothetical protein [Streptomyces abyssalis]OEU86855.1 hypothetical protein DB35_24945 [Streptomyces abyssalis]OEU89761.1 hypothetical protein AN215_08620 [Streptomyces abyssalis]OEV30895.1 hypothetical protein AN219_08185 [Streptomyces nanshensis]
MDPPLGVVTLCAQEREGEVDTFDLADPAFGLGPCATFQKIGFQLIQPGEHLGIDVQHRAADASVLVLASEDCAPTVTWPISTASGWM